ncbi:CDH23 [Mytilus coruscus]|uniref:CDH23 n=1 Tax=Mytilus coruscus TaxID=42192 RepID=A0A6J8E7X5_MYTCO|nr:CDH23 [Mytilus coruscus]
MEVILKFGMVCTLILSLSQKGLSQQYPPRFDSFPSLVQFNEGCSTTRVLATIRAHGLNGNITISANDDATRAKVNIVQTNTSNAGGYSTTVQIIQKECMDRENASLSTEVLKVEATDPDNGVGGVVRYSLISSALYDSAFGIDETTGSITVKKELDYSKLSFYQYLIFGTDGGGLKGNATMIIKIQDIQNKPPYFTGQPYNAEIPEESPVGTTVNFSYPIRADDGDTGVPHAIEYSFTEGKCKHFFEINSNGDVTVKERIDRDDGVIHKFRGVCTLTLMALEKVSSSETDPGPSNSTTPVVITIIDIDDNLPKFSMSIYNATVFENLKQIPLTIEGDRINVTDVDQDTHSLLHLEIQYDNGTRVYGINPVPDMVQGSGNIMLYLQDDFSFDFEKVKEISYTLVASEKKEPAKTTYCTVHLEIIDRNDNLPQFTKSSFIVHIEENNTNVQQVLSEKATDKDSGEFAEITYSLRGGGDIFVVNNVTGNITKRENETLDYEKRDEYVLTLVAKDGGGSLQPAEVIVRLDDINDNQPVFTQSSYIGFVTENVKNFEINVSASDRDKKNTSNSRVEFNLIESPFHMENNFTIGTIQQSDEFLGNISLKGSLDYEKLNKTAKGQVKLYVFAKDFGNPSLSSTCTVIINIQDLNDNTPVFDPPEYKEHIFENATAGDYVGNVTATDEDGTKANKDLSYYIITGSELFRIDGESGVITVNLNSKFDRETTPVYNLTIVAVDRGTPPRTGNTNFTVVIDDVNDTPPKFDKDKFSASVSENKKVGSSVKICSATDDDLDFHLFYKILDLQTSNSDNDTVKNWFRINNATGEVTINSTLDREFNRYSNTYTYSRRHECTTLSVSLLDVNDNKPSFLENYYVNITEGKISGPVITVEAHDPDKNPKITYRITKNYLTNTFSIDPKTEYYNENIKEDRDPNYQIISVTVKDRDINQSFRFSIELETNRESLFRINEHNGLISVNASLYFNYGVKELTVWVEDIGGLKNSTSVYILVEDINDNPPVFNGLKAFYKIYECAKVGSRVTILNTTDADYGDNSKVSYTFIDQTVTGKNYSDFLLNTTTGEITTAKNLSADGYYIVCDFDVSAV